MTVDRVPETTAERVDQALELGVGEGVVRQVDDPAAHAATGVVVATTRRPSGCVGSSAPQPASSVPAAHSAATMVARCLMRPRRY